MDKAEKVRQAFMKLTAPDTCTILGLVKSVDEDEKTIVLVDDQTGVEFFDVRLKPVIDDTDFITIIPKINTWCIAVRIEDDQDYFVLNVAEADKYFIKIGDQELVMDGGKFLIKSGGESLGKIMNDLLTAVLLMSFTTNNGPTIKLINSQSFTAIKNRLNNILQQ